MVLQSTDCGRIEEESDGERKGIQDLLHMPGNKQTLFWLLFSAIFLL